MLSFGCSSLSWPEPREGILFSMVWQCIPQIHLALLDGAKFQNTQARSLSRFVLEFKKILKILTKRGLKFRQFLEAGVLTLHCESRGAPTRFLSPELGKISAENCGRTTTGINLLKHDRHLCDCLNTAFIMFCQYT